jgi:hypothetical protein
MRTWLRDEEVASSNLVTPTGRFLLLVALRATRQDSQYLLGDDPQTPGAGLRPQTQAGSCRDPLDPSAGLRPQTPAGSCRDPRPRCGASPANLGGFLPLVGLWVTRQDSHYLRGDTSPAGAPVPIPSGLRLPFPSGLRLPSLDFPSRDFPSVRTILLTSHRFEGGISPSV